MQRKATKTTRGANADEKRFMSFVKESDCIGCGLEGPSIVDHIYGATFKHKKVLVGMWALLPYCELCDSIKTIDGRAAHDSAFSFTQAELFEKFLEDVPTPLRPPPEVIASIKDWGR